MSKEAILTEVAKSRVLVGLYDPREFVALFLPLVKDKMADPTLYRS